MPNIDLAFLRQLEGFSLDGYVPSRSGIALGRSGVTIAMGVDLGQMTAQQIRSLAIPDALKAKLMPYTAPARGAFARKILEATPLDLTQDEADLLDTAMLTPRLNELTVTYDSVVIPASRPGWYNLPPAARTVIASVFWQYGDDRPDVSCPRFWAACCAQDWQAVYDELMDFGDIYPTRRHTEAAYLAAGLGLPISNGH